MRKIDMSASSSASLGSRYYVPRMRIPVSALLVLALGSCTTGASTHATAPDTVASATAGAGQLPEPSRAAAQVTFRDAGLESDDDLVQFMLPANNIGCALGQAFVTCQIGQADWAGEQTRPTDCEGDWDPHGISLNNGTTHLGGCASDSVLGGGVLPYGYGLQSREVRCASSVQGLRCELRASGHGFQVNRKAFHRF